MDVRMWALISLSDGSLLSQVNSIHFACDVPWLNIPAYAVPALFLYNKYTATRMPPSAFKASRPARRIGNAGYTLTRPTVRAAEPYGTFLYALSDRRLAATIHTDSNYTTRYKHETGIQAVRAY